jgi:hypothetical protein
MTRITPLALDVLRLDLLWSLEVSQNIAHEEAKAAKTWRDG